jgi:dolichol-phosphate mannosyltransferase
MISFIFPAFNEAENLARFPAEVFPVFDALGESYEIVVVDDGSSDATADVARGLGDRVRLVSHDQNRGLGAAVRTGIREARGELVITMDTDLTFAPSLVPKLLERFRRGDVDVVSGSPKLAGYDEKIPFYRVLVSYVASLVYAVVMGKWMRDVSPIFRLYRREQLITLPLRTNRFEINAEILFYLIRDGRRIVEIPAPLTQRIHGESNLDYKKEIVRHLRLVGRMIRLRALSSLKTVRFRDVAWWVGVPVVTLATTWLPNVIWNLLAGPPLSSAFWRVTISPGGVFDSYIYFHWLGALLLGIDSGSQLSWLSHVFLALDRIVPKGTSIIEFWLITRWMATVATLWIGGWCVRRWSGLGEWPARVISCVLWFGLLFTLNFRPGIFSWYWPFAALGLTLALVAAEQLDLGKWKTAAALSVAGIALAAIYPWFLAFVGIWVAVIWCLWIIARRPAAFFVLLLGGIVLLFGAAPALARWFLDPARLGWLEANVRNGIGFSRMPFLANTALLAFGWIVLVGGLVRAKAKSGESYRSLFLLLTAWLALFFVWFHSPFTGLFVHNDHFSSPIVFLGWMSLAAVWPIARTAAPAVSKKTAFVVAIIASAFFLYIFRQPVAGNILKFSTYVIHLAGWFSLAAAGWLVVIGNRWSGKRKAWLFLPIILVGIIGWGSVVAKDASTMGGIKTRAPEIAWIEQRVAPSQTLCAEPDSAAFYAAHTGYAVLPSEGPIAYPVPTETILHQLETIAGSLNVAAVHAEPVFLFYANYYEGRLCQQFSRQAAILRKLGYSTEKVNAIIGCPQADLDAHALRITQAIQKHALDAAAFSEVCPFVIIDSPDRKQYWNLPASYQEQTFPDGGAIWMKPQGSR